MLKRNFTSSKSSDVIEVIYFKKSYQSNLTIKLFDDFFEHLKLINNIIVYLQDNDIKWICLQLANNFKVPQNTIWFKHNKTGNICCHIEDFEQFYLQNMDKAIKLNSIYIDILPSKQDNDGWTTVVNKKKLRKNKFNTIKDHIHSLTGDWNTF